MSWRHLASTVLLVVGCALEVWSIVGLVALRNAYDRLHCLGLAGYGALLVACAIVVRESFSLIGDKALATGVVLVLFGPVLAHTTARSLRIREHGDWRAKIDGDDKQREQ